MATANKAYAVRHLAVIMDGNGRWAERRGLERVAGHRAGADAVLRTVKAAREFGIECLTLYAFSTENWKRSPGEVNALMGLLAEFLDEKLPDLMREGIRLKSIGRIAGLPAEPRRKLEAAIAATAGNRAGTLVLALNYGGRAEITDAAAAIAREARDGKLDPDRLDEAAFARHLYAPELPDPELLIRTSGELRLSNFLLWELAYSEIFITDTLWPDFTRDTLFEALEAFAGRERRFGGRNKKSC